MATDWGGLIGGGIDLISSGIKDNARDDYANLLQRQEQNNYDTSLANHNAYNDWLANVHGPASAANQAARDAAGRAAAGAAQANEAARAAAAGKASKLLAKRFKKSMKMLRPSINITNAVLPKMQDTYNRGTDGLNLLQAYLNAPQMMNRMAEAGTPVTAVNVGELPAHMRGK